LATTGWLLRPVTPPLAWHSSSAISRTWRSETSRMAIGRGSEWRTPILTGSLPWAVMRLGIPTPAARPAPATTEPFRNSRRVTAMTSPFLCAVGAALRASVRRRSDGGCGPARSRAGSVAAPPTDDVVRSAPGRGASDVPRLIPGNSGHYEEDGLDDCLFGRHIAGDRLRHEQRPGDVGHGAATVHRGPSEPLERRLLTEVVAPHQRALGPLDHLPLIEPQAKGLCLSEPRHGQIERGRQLGGTKRLEQVRHHPC